MTNIFSNYILPDVIMSVFLFGILGIPDDRDGLLDTIQRSKSHYQKRAYQCIKMMVALFMQ